MGERKLVVYASTWGCSYCHTFQHISRDKCFHCGANKEDADWIVDANGYIIPMGE